MTGKQIFGLLVLVGGLVTVGLAAYEALAPRHPEPVLSTASEVQPAAREAQASNTLARQWSRGQCEGDGAVALSHLPMDLADFSHYLPYGLMTGAHVTPIDHSYFSPAEFNSPRDAYPVYAVADGFIVEVGHRASFPDGPHGTSRELDEYRVVIEHSCSFYSYFDLATSLAPQVAGELSKYDQAGNWSEPTRIPIQAGKEIARIGGQTLDFGVYNAEVMLDFFSPELYEWEFWKIHTDDPFPHFASEAREELLAKNTRVAEPVGGRIDYDEAGTLLGNWFAEGTNGYAGAGERYWEGHLAVVYDFLDPTQVRISTGDPRFEGGPYGVAGNSPDPAQVTPETGLVPYELTQFGYVNAVTGEAVGRAVMEPGEYRAVNEDQGRRGYALFEVLPGERLRVELFPEATSAPAGFTDSALIFER